MPTAGPVHPPMHRASSDYACLTTRQYKAQSQGRCVTLMLEPRTLG
jgi:hypothetical protein